MAASGAFGISLSSSDSPTTVSVDGPGRSALQKLLMSPDIEPGSDPSYQMCKIIYLYHPLGGKMAEGPITMAQCQPRKISVDDAPDDVAKEFAKKWKEVQADSYIHNVHSLKRVYGIATLVAGCAGMPTDKPLDMPNLWKHRVYFSVLDPLNTSGSLVLNQDPNSPDFLKPTRVVVNGQEYHPSRARVVMNEHPVYIAYTNSSFGYSGRSVYQRGLFALKSFIRSMIADDVIMTKNAVLVAKQKQPGSVATNMMAKIFGFKRALLKEAESGEVLSVDKDEDVETLNMQNVKESGEYARTNILKNLATSGDMPAKVLENETMVSGFGEGTEDAKTHARYVESIRMSMDPEYDWMGNIVQYLAWTPDFFARMQRKYPDAYAGKTFEDVFSQWRENYSATWPSLLIEPESEKVKVEETKSRTIISTLESRLATAVDPENEVRVLEWAADELAENKLMFRHALVLDFDTLRHHKEEEVKRRRKMEDAGAPGDQEGNDDPQPAPKPRVQKLAAIS